MSTETRRTVRFMFDNYASVHRVVAELAILVNAEPEMRQVTLGEIIDWCQPAIPEKLFTLQEILEELGALHKFSKP